MPPKTGHSRVKALDFDEEDGYSDEYSDEDVGDGITDEDREQLRLGSMNVKAALGPSLSIPDTEIQEALWHYYFEVAKAVTYLRNKYAPMPKPATQTKKPKPISRFDQAAASTSGGASGHPALLPLHTEYHSMSASDFFKDTPWLNVPIHRRGDIFIEPLCPRGGLLGGSSKLAALAAARKRKQEEAKAASTPQNSGAADNAEMDRAVALLDRLKVKDNPKDASAANSRPSEPSYTQKPSQMRHPSRRKKSPSPPPVQKEEDSMADPIQEPVAAVPDIRAPPSTFAATMFGALNPGIPVRSSEGSLFSIPLYRAKQPADNDPFAGPSPDDIVTNAQTKGTKTKKSAPHHTSGDKAANDVTNSVAALGLSVEEVPKVKSKNLDVLKEFEQSNMKRMANFVVIGHVDHGKSTLMGRLLYDLKVIDERSVNKLRKEAETIGKSSFALAWVMDQTSEERSRGVTVDIATNFFETEKTRFTILDAPGHRDFIPNMIAGASQADFAVLVIDAGINSFESGLKGQTKEHAMLVRSMGVQRLVVAVNKMDTVEWSKARFNEISQQMTAFLITASFAAKNLTFVPCAGLTGENIVRSPPAGTFPEDWYTGPTLINAFDASEPAKRALTLPLRITVSDVFRGGIMHPLSISGRIDAGSLQVGDTVLAMPSGETSIIKGIETKSESIEWAVAGQIVTLHLSDIDAVHLRLGDIICHPSNPIATIKTFTAKILAFEDVFPMSVDVFRGRMNAPAKVVRLVATVKKGTGQVEKKRPKIVQQGALAKVVVELEREMPLELGTRVVLRANGETVAAGVLDSVA